MTQFEYTLWYVLLICEDYKIPTGEPLYIVCMSMILLLNNGEFPTGSKTWDNFTFYSWKDLSLQLFGSVRKKKKCKTIEFISINYLRPWRGVEFHAKLCTGFFHPVLVSAFYTCKRLRPVLNLPRHSWDIEFRNDGKGARKKSRGKHFPAYSNSH